MTAPLRIDVPEGTCSFDTTTPSGATGLLERMATDPRRPLTLANTVDLFRRRAAARCDSPEAQRWLAECVMVLARIWERRAQGTWSTDDRDVAGLVCDARAPQDAAVDLAGCVGGLARELPGRRGAGVDSAWCAFDCLFQLTMPDHPARRPMETVLDVHGASPYVVGQRSWLGRDQCLADPADLFERFCAMALGSVRVVVLQTFDFLRSDGNQLSGVGAGAVLACALACAWDADRTERVGPQAAAVLLEGLRLRWPRWAGTGQTAWRKHTPVAQAALERIVLRPERPAPSDPRAPRRTM